MDIQSLYKVIHKKYRKAKLIEVPNEEKYILIPIQTIEFEIHFNRIYKDLDGKLNKTENAIQFVCDRDDENKEYLTSYKGIKKEKIYANMMRGIFYHNPMNEEVDTEEHVVEVFNAFVETRTMKRVENHCKYVDEFIILYNSKTGKVEEINQITCESDGLQWNTISISGDTSMGSSVHLITKLYDASGMDMSLKIAGKAEGEAKVTTNKELDGYAGSLDLSIVPEIKGEIVVDTPVFDKNLLKQPLFEAALKPLWEKHWESSVNWQDDLQWKENDKNEESQETTKVSYSNEYFEVIVPESWEGEWTVTEEDNTMNGIKSTLYRFSHDPADGEEGGAADVYVLDMSDTSRPLSHYSRMLPSAGCEEVGLTSFGYNDVFKMEVANGFFYENGATITLK